MIDRVFPVLNEALKVKYSGYFADTLSTIRDSLHKLDAFSVVDSVPEKFLTTILTKRFWSVCYKTFVYEMHVYREEMNLPVDETSSVAFNSFLDQFSAATIEDWFIKYPILESMVVSTAKGSLTFAIELFSALQKDSLDLVNYGLITPRCQIDDIVFLESDWHNGSRCVVAFSVNETPTVVYKPRSLAIDCWFDKMFRIISRNDDEFPSPVPLTLNRDSYGWQQFVASFPMFDHLLGESFRRLGFVSALLTATGANDIHDENLVFQADKPFLIDLETAMQPRSVQFSQNLSGSLLKTLHRSICSTSIIPAKLPTVPHNFLIGAINTPYPQQTRESIFVLRNPGTDAMDIAKESTPFPRLAEPMAVVSGDAVNPIPFQQNFVDGYRLGYRRIIQHREELLKALDGICFPVRRVLRPTAKYGRFFEALLFPENLVSVSAVSRVTQYLKPLVNQFPQAQADKILEQELAALEAGDIPYFYTFADECSVRCNTFSVCPKEGVSPLDNAKDTLLGMSEDNLLQDERFIAEGFSEIRLSMSRYLNEEVKSPGIPMFNDCLKKDNAALTSSLFNLFSALAVKGDSSVGWFCGLYGDMPVSYHSESFISFHDAAGIVLPLTRFSKTFVSNSYAASFRDKAIDGIKHLSKQYSESVRANQPSIVSGPSSIDFVLNHNQRKLVHTEYDTNEVDESDSLGDVFSGLVGQYLLLASFADVSQEILKLNYSRLRDFVAQTYNLSGGIAHGDLGRVWALLRISNRLNDQLGQSIAVETLGAFNLASLNMQKGYCNGGAGLLLVKSETAQLSNCISTRELREIASQITDLPIPGTPIDLSVCHGASGITQSLLQSYFYTGDSFLRDLAINYWSKALEHARNFGYYTGEINRDYLLGYFLGWSGVFDTSLMVYSPETWHWTPIAFHSSASSKRTTTRR